MSQIISNFLFIELKPLMCPRQNEKLVEIRMLLGKIFLKEF